MNLCGETLMQNTFYKNFFFRVIWKIHLILYWKEKTLFNSDD